MFSLISPIQSTPNRAKLWGIIYTPKRRRIDAIRGQKRSPFKQPLMSPMKGQGVRLWENSAHPDRRGEKNGKERTRNPRKRTGRAVDRRGPKEQMPRDFRRSLNLVSPHPSLEERRATSTWKMCLCVEKTRIKGFCLH